MKLLLVQTGFIGDVILSTPVIDALKKLYPESEITFLTTPVAADLVRFHPGVSETLVFDKRGRQRGLSGLLEMASELKRCSFDAVFSLHKSWRTAALLFLSGIRSRYGFTRASARWLYSGTAQREDLSHEVLRNLAIIRAVGADLEHAPTRMHVEVPSDVCDSASMLLGGLAAEPYICLAPGSVWATKRWTPEGFAGVAKAFLSQGYGVVILGGPGDRQAADAVVSMVEPSDRLLDLSGKSSLIQSAAIIAGAQLLVTNDSAPLHLASATQCPVVAVFCATVPEFGFGPWETPSECVGLEDLDCRPCARHGGKECPIRTNECQKGVSAAMVLAAAERVLERAAEANTKHSPLR